MPNLSQTVNLCANPSFEVDASGWGIVGAGVSIVQDTLHAVSGTASGKVTWADAGPYAQAVTQGVAGLIAGSTYTFSAYVFVPAGAPRVSLDVTGASGTAQSGASSATGVWERLQVSFTASTSTATVRLICFDASTAGDSAWLDAVLVEQGNSSTEYADGDYPDWRWTASPGLSTSYRAIFTNLISDPSFEADNLETLPLWVPNRDSVTLERDQDVRYTTDRLYNGLIRTGDQPDLGIEATLSIEDGVSYTFSAEAGADLGSGVVARLAVGLIDPVTAEETVVFGDPTAVDSDGMTRLSLTFTTNVDQEYVKLYVLAVTPLSTLHVDRAMLVAGETAYDYFDGYTHSRSLWRGVPDASQSVYVVNTALSASGGGNTRGQFFVSLVEPIWIEFEGTTYSTGVFAVGVYIPPGAMDDFGIADVAQLDPAITQVVNNSDPTQTDESWIRPWTSATAPRAYHGASEDLLWDRAAYVGLGLRWTGVSASKYHYYDKIMLEDKGLLGSPGIDPAPADWSPARQIIVSVKADRVNLCNNPSFEVSGTNWGAVGCTITQDTSRSVFGNNSGLVTVSDIESAYIISDFIPVEHGEAITHSCSLQAGTVTSVFLRARFYDALLNPLPSQDGSPVALSSTTDWDRPALTSYAPVGAAFVRFCVVAEGAPSGGTFWIDGVLVEKTPSVNDYFDASFPGTDYLWEGEPQESPSHYYRGRREKQYRLDEVIRKSVPNGASWQILYAQPTVALNKSVYTDSYSDQYT